MKTTLIETFDVSVDELFKVVSDLDNFQWRSDLSNVHVLEDQRYFQEVSLKGQISECEITEFILNERYVVVKKSKNTRETCDMKFGIDKKGKSLIIIEDELIVLNPIIKFLSAGLFDNEKLVKAYLHDLKKRFK